MSELGDSLLQSGDDLEPLSLESSLSSPPAMASREASSFPPPRVTLEVHAGWSRPQDPFLFDPVLRSAFLERVVSHRAYSVLWFFAACAGAMQLVMESSTGDIGWETAVMDVLFFLCLPLVFLEFVHMSRELLWQLAGCFEFYFLMLNYTAMHIMGLVLNITVGVAHGGGTLLFLCASFFTFSLDAMLVKRSLKCLWLALYICYLGAIFLLNRFRFHSADDVNLCWLDCTTAYSIRSSSMLTILLFALKHLWCLLRGEEKLMLIRPHATLHRITKPREQFQSVPEVDR